MITKSERRFINQWAEQKSGPRWKYYLQFTIAWTIVSFFLIFFLTKLFTNAWEKGGRLIFLLFIGVSVVIGFLATHFTYVNSEKRYHKIINRDEKSAIEN